MTWLPNPKQAGSRICDCVPLPGPCPNNCPDCYYNRPGAFYASLDQPIFPSPRHARNKVVRVNSGGDSNYQRNYVIKSTSCYPHRFFNTSRPDLGLDFPEPVVVTVNPKNFTDWFYAISAVENIMFVRVKITSWNYDLTEDAIQHYTSLNIPVVLTDMRFYTESLVLEHDDYEYRTHVKNPYWCLKHDIWRQTWAQYVTNPLVFSCGSPKSPYCRDCENCWELYWYWHDHDDRRLTRLKDRQITAFEG